MLWWLVGAAAAAAPQQGGGSVELLRYVTPYATGLDVLVDVSAYAPLLLARGGPLQLYSFVDTWVGNDTKPEVWSDRKSTQERCELRVLEGNGWALHAELLFFARGIAASGGAVLGAVAPAPFGAPLELGALEVATGLFAGAGAATVDGRVLRAPRDAEAFWPCRGPEDVQRALRASWALAQPANATNATRDVLLRRALAAPRRVAAVDDARRTARVELEAGDTGWGVGDAVYLEKRMAVLTESGEAVNGVAPLDPVGRVVKRAAGAATVELDALGCLPELGWELRTAEPTEPSPHRAAARWAGKRAEIPASDGADGSLCVAAAAASPRVADTEVDLGTLAPGERVRVRVTATGHGWSFTAEHCGEYCEIEYTLLLDGAVAGRFRPWRDDCGENPLGNRQHGTWKESRNGWCPGAVSDGWWADVTEFVPNGGRVRVALDALVVGDPAYNNSAGFAFDERAVVQAAVTFFREPPASRQAGVVRRAKAAAPAGAAPWFSYVAEAAEPPQHRVPVFSGELHQAGSRVLERAIELPVGLDASTAWDVALHLRLAAPPPPLQVDRWDRFATFGVRL